MKRKLIQNIALSLVLLSSATIPVSLNAESQSGVKLEIKHSALETEAGLINFDFVRYIIHRGGSHKIKEVIPSKNQLVMTDGSVWSVVNLESIAGWEKASDLYITQNCKAFSKRLYALVNCETKKAVPMDLVIEPRPNSKEILFIQAVDPVNNLVVTSDDKKWIIHSSDNSVLKQFKENDRVVIGANVSENSDKSPYLLINTAHNASARANLIEVIPAPFGG